MENETLAFATLDERIRKMPDGPASVLNTPRWVTWFNVIGTAGIIIGIAPYIAIQFVEAKMWMVTVARIGLWTSLVGYFPYMLRSAVVISREFWFWRRKLVVQSDHDLARFRELRHWLRKFPRNELEDHYRFAVLTQKRLTAKLVFLQGGFDKLGIMPALLSLLWLLRNAGDLSIETLLQVPRWQSWLAIMFAIMYLIGLMALLMRLRLQLYETVLADALDLKSL